MPTQPNHLVINPVFDSSVTSSPQEANFESAVNSAINYLEAEITTPITISIEFGYGDLPDVNGGAATPLAPASGAESLGTAFGYTYSQVYNALEATDKTSPVQLAAAASLPSADPTGAAGMNVYAAEAMALGLSVGSLSNGFVGAVGLSVDNYVWSETGSIGADQSDAVSELEHEITEIMGRVDFAGNGGYTPLDLFDYTAANGADGDPIGAAAGARDEPFVSGYSANAFSYFSYNGKTVTLEYDTPYMVSSAGGGQDVADWDYLTAINDSFDGAGGPGTFDPVSLTDLEEENVQGYDLTTKLVVPSGVATFGNVVSSGYSETVLSGAVASGSLVSGGGTEVAAAHGRIVGTTVSNGGYEYALSGGTTTGTTVNGGGHEIVSSGGIAFETSVMNGGTETVAAAAAGDGLRISAGGALDGPGALLGDNVIYGAAYGVGVAGGGFLTPIAGGVVSATHVLSGGTEVVASGGRGNGTTVSSGGYEYVLSSGTTTGTTVTNGGNEIISSGGEAIELTVLAGASTIDNGEIKIGGPGTLDGTVTGSGVIVQTEAGDLVLGDSGAGFSGGAVIEGGTVELATAGALGTGYAQFVAPSTGSAVLQIDAADAPAAGGTFANTIYNFSGANEDIDLRSIAYVAGAAATVSGTTLVLTDGGATYKFKLAGSIGAAFPVVSDGHGGTLIDPAAAPAHKAVDPHVLAFTHAAAAFAPSGAANMALVSSTSPTGNLFLHATGSATAARF